MKIMDLIKPFSISSRSMRMTIFWLVTSRAEEGSSAMSTLGDRMVEMAMTVRCFIPPEMLHRVLFQHFLGQAPKSGTRSTAMS